MLNKILEYMRKLTSIFVIIMFVIVVVVVFGQVVMRYVFHNSLSWADELSRFAFVWLVYLGGTITIREGRNICFDLILEAAKGKMWRILFAVVNLVSLAFLIMMTWLGVLVSQANIGELSPIIGLKMEYVTLAIPIGGMLMVFEQISYYIAKVNIIKDKELEVIN